MVIDDSAVKNAEIGRGGSFKAIALVVVGIATGVAVGWGVGSVTQDREQYNLALRDGKEIYQSVQTASKTIEAAQAELKKAVTASQSGPGKVASVDYDAVSNLVGLKKPFSANEFHRRRYRAFPAPVVDDLFDYYNNINQIWDKIAALGAKTAGENRRAALDESARAADGLVRSQYGVVLSKVGEGVAGGLVYVAAPEAPEEGQDAGGKKKDKDGMKVQVSANVGGRTVDRTLYTGQRDLGVNFQDYVVMVDKLRSREILGQGATVFADYQNDLMQIAGLMGKVTEAQGRLTQELGKIAALEAQGL